MNVSYAALKSLRTSGCGVRRKIDLIFQKFYQTGATVFHLNFMSLICWKRGSKKFFDRKKTPRAPEGGGYSNIFPATMLAPYGRVFEQKCTVVGGLSWEKGSMYGLFWQKTPKFECVFYETCPTIGWTFNENCPASGLVGRKCLTWQNIVNNVSKK